MVILLCTAVPLTALRSSFSTLYLPWPLHKKSVSHDLKSFGACRTRVVWPRQKPGAGRKRLSREETAACAVKPQLWKRLKADGVKQDLAARGTDLAALRLEAKMQVAPWPC